MSAKGQALSLREEQRAVTRARILKAARRAFAEDSYVAASVEDIAVRAGVSRATFYLHYQSKEAVLRALLEEDVARQFALFDLFPSDGKRSRASIEAWIRRYLDGFRRRRDSVRLFNLVMALDPTYVAYFDQKRDEFAAVLAGSVAAFRAPSAKRARAAHRAQAHLLFYQVEQLAFHAAFLPEGHAGEGVTAAAEAVERFLARWTEGRT
ncbi:MAG: TetR/AcrR family transcriptional regulator [Hyphomonadaceae bacterium]